MKDIKILQTTVIYCALTVVYAGQLFRRFHASPLFRHIPVLPLQLLWPGEGTVSLSP